MQKLSYSCFTLSVATESTVIRREEGLQGGQGHSGDHVPEALHTTEGSPPDHEQMHPEACLVYATMNRNQILETFENPILYNVSLPLFKSFFNFIFRKHILGCIYYYLIKLIVL